MTEAPHLSAELTLDDGSVLYVPSCDQMHPPVSSGPMTIEVDVRGAPADRAITRVVIRTGDGREVTSNLTPAQPFWTQPMFLHIDLPAQESPK